MSPLDSEGDAASLRPKLQQIQDLQGVAWGSVVHLDGVKSREA